MPQLARACLSALVLLLACLAPPASAQPVPPHYDTALVAGAAARLEQDIRQRVLRPNERPQPQLAQQATELALALVRERKYVEALPLLERAIAHGGGTFAVWIAYSNAQGGQRTANHRRALEAAYVAWKKAADSKSSALALYFIGYWHEIMREADAGIAAYEDSLKLENNPTVRNRLNQMVMQYRHQVVETKADVDSEQPRICLTFSKALPENDNALFARFVAIEPAVKAAFSAKERTLCIAGVAFSQSYKITIRQGLPSTSQLTVPRTETYTIGVPDRAVTLAFRSKAYILPKASRQGIPLATINVERAEIRVLRINDRNLINEIVGERIREMLYEHTAKKIEESQGELVWSGQMRIQSERNKEATTAIPFADAVKDPKPGIYVVLARSVGKTKAEKSEDESETSEWATQWVVVTDIGVSTYSSAEGGLSVFARSYESAQPRAGVQVRLMARNNEVLGTATTDATGRANFPAGLMRGLGGNRAAALLMSTAEGEFAFIDIVRSAFDLTDRGVGGREAPTGADAFVYTERGVYRPGETVHATALLRDNNGVALGDTPLVVRLMRPDGVEAQRFTLRTTSAGGYTVSIAIPKSAATGAWRLLAHVDPKGAAIGSTAFKVEDFVPERLEMTLSAEPKILAPGKPIKISVVGRFLYGAPAADLAVDGEMTIKLDPQPFSQYQGYFFGQMTERFDPKRKEIAASKTDAKGDAALDIGLDEKLVASRPLMADIRVTLNEEGGRAIERRVSVAVAHRPLYLGLKLDAEDGAVAENRPAKFLVVGLDRTGTAKAAKLKFELVREVYEYQWYNQDGRWNYRGVLRNEPVQKGELDLAADKPGELAFTTSSGRYRLDVVDDATGATASYRYSVGWVFSGDTEEVPDKLQVRLDKASYKAGETAKVSVRPPFAGTVHIVVASDRVLASRIETVPADGKVIDIAVDESWGTGVYVLATAYRPNGKAERLGPSRAIGVAYLARDTAERVLTVKLTAPEMMTPRKKLDVKVAVDGARGEPIFITLAAVDEGVLALTNYKTPAPDSHFYSKRKLALELRDDYGRLIDAYAGRLGEIRQGGDDSARHLGGLDVSTIQVVSLYSGIVRVDEKGEATVSLDVPDFNGRLRVMAVAWTANKLGKGEQNVTVRDPVVSTVTLPRFLAPDDQGRVTVVIHNVDGVPGAYRVRLTATGEGAATVAAPAEATVQIAKDQRQRLAFTLVGVRPGTAAIELSIQGPQNFALTRHWDIAVRPAQANVAKFMVSQLDKGQSFSLGARELGEFLPGTASLYLTVGTTPDLGTADLISSLDRYPYGCAEQTTSRALPLLYMAEVAQAIGIAKDEPAIRDRVQQAIYRVLAMQQRDGGFGMWSSFDEGGGWLTAFIMDFLTQAKAKGYVVPDIAFEQGLKRLDQLARDLAYEGPALRVLTYAHYVLAVNKKGDVATVRYLHDTQLKEMPTALAKAQLAATLALFGDGARAKTAFDAARTHGIRPVADDRSYRALVQDYGTVLRDQAGVLALASTAQPQGADITQVFASVRAGRSQQTYLSTQEQAWLLLAVHGLGTPGADWKAKIGGVDKAGSGKQFASRYAAAALGQRFDVANTGNDKIWIGATVTGIPAKDQPAAKNGFEITRVFYNLKGERVDLSKVRQSDVLVALIRVSAQGSRPHQAMIVDLLPAGFEIENPRLDRRDPEQMKWLPELAQPRATEPRDDRFVAAVDIWSNKRDFFLAYVVRAVTPGTFRLPAAYVEDMYAPAVMGRDAMSKVTILPRQ